VRGKSEEVWGERETASPPLPLTPGPSPPRGEGSKKGNDLTMLPLWAVHIADNVLATEWWVGGLVGAAVLAALGAWRIRDEEIPRVALLSAAFFVASSFHLRVGPTSVHLLLNGLVGVILGWRACLAIPIGLLLQYLLVSHGGYYTLGVNSCVLALPALGAWGLFRALQRVPWLRHPWFRSALVGLCAFVWLLSLVYSATLLVTNPLRPMAGVDTSWADFLTFHPATLACALLATAAIVCAERKLENAPEFALGLLIGELTVLATVALNCLVLLLGGETDWTMTVLLTIVLHLPLAALEGVVVGFTVGFLARVKPEMLGLLPARDLPPAGLAPAAAPERESDATAIFAGAPPRSVAGRADGAGSGA
jgi:cobalt/nickel transport system permease protein